MSQSAIHERNQELLRLAKTGDAEAEEKLLLENAGLLHSIVRRFLGRGTEEEDLLQIASIGMLRAIRSFDPTLGNAFSTYAVPLILGELRRHFRDSGPVKVSRLYKQKGAQLLHERTRLEAELGREPTLCELAKATDMEPEEAAVALQALSPVASFSDPLSSDEGLTYEAVLADEDSRKELERLTDSIALSQCMRKLPAEWKRIILLRYYRNLTQCETAALIGVTQVKVSREEKKILAFFKKELS